MPITWLLHAVGFSDLGVPVREPTRTVLVAERAEVLTRAAEHELRALLVSQGWDAPVSGQTSPLAAAMSVLPDETPDLRLALVCSPTTQPIADALRAAIGRVPAVFGRVFTRTCVVVTDGVDGYAGLGEQSVVAALLPYLSDRDHAEPANAVAVWGSGATQLVLGMAEAATVAGLPWILLGVSESPVPTTVVRFNPESGGVDPIVPLLRRWHYHAKLSELAERSPLGLNDAQRALLRTDAERWQRAHERPSPDGLRLLLVDALARGDVTTGFVVRRYVLAHYHELRLAEGSEPLDLQRWATKRWRGNDRSDRVPTLGDIIRLVHSAASSARGSLAQSIHSVSGQWLRSRCVGEMNELGRRASHELAPPTPTQLRWVREHLIATETAVPNGAGLPPVGTPPAATAWYLRLAGLRADDPRQDLLGEILRDGVDTPVAGYLGLPSTDVGVRFLLLGTLNGSVSVAEQTCADLNARAEVLANGERPMARWAAVPADPAWNPDIALALLRTQFAPIADEIGAIVLVPTGLKPVLLPLIIAAHRLAAEHGVPLFLRQNNAPHLMHRLPLRFGADRDLLELATEAVSTLELDVAARLLDACSDTQNLAARTRELANALHCRKGPLPAGIDRCDPGELGAGLMAERLQVWARLAAEHPDPANHTRAIIGAWASVERSARTTARASTPNSATQARTDLLTEIRRATQPSTRLLRALMRVRNTLPTSHGNVLSAPDELDRLVHAELRRATGTAETAVTVAEFLRLTASAAGRWSALPSSRTARQPTLPELLTDLAGDIAQRQSAELERLARHQIRLGAAILHDIDS